MVSELAGIFQEVTMKKRVFTTYWFYFYGGIFIVLFCVGVIISEVIQIITVSVEVNPTMEVSYWLLPVLILLAIFMIAAMGFVCFQFTILTEDGIKVRCAWFTIRKLKWEEVKEVRLERFDISVPGAFKSKWYVFDDGVKRSQKNGLASKAGHITLSYSKRAKRAVEEFWKGEIKENAIK